MLIVIYVQIKEDLLPLTWNVTIRHCFIGKARPILDIQKTLINIHQRVKQILSKVSRCSILLLYRRWNTRR